MDKYAEAWAVLGITIKYQGIKDAPVLLTPEGRFPTGPGEVSPTSQPRPPGELYLGQGGAELRLAVLKQEQEQVVGEVGRRVEALLAATEKLPAPASDLVDFIKTALSSDPAALSASADQEATIPATYSVEAQWPSQGGLILSSPQNPIAPIDLDDGEHAFTLTIDGVGHELSVKAYNGSVRDDQSLLGGLAQPSVDTQEEFLTRLARAIDGVDPRLKASLEYSFQDAHDPGPRSRPLNRVVRLKVESVAEGQGPHFSLSDLNGQAVGAYKLDQGRPARPARLRLLGALRDQSTGALSLDQGHVTGQVLASTPGGAEVAARQGPEPFTQAMGALVSQYNDLVSYLDTHADVLRPSLKDRLIRPLQERARLMDALGLKPSPQGLITPTSLFSRQVSGNFAAVRKALLGSEGWVSALGEKLDQIQSTGYGNFAAELSQATTQEQARRAWDLLDQVRSDIINGYY